MLSKMGDGLNKKGIVSICDFPGIWSICKSINRMIIFFLLLKGSIVLDLEPKNFVKGKDGLDKEEDDDARRDKLRIGVQYFDRAKYAKSCVL